MTEPGSNLARVLALLGEMSHSQTMAPLVDAMAEDVVWQGLLPELVCHGRDEVRDVLSSARGGQLPRVTRLEAEEAGDRVVLTIQSSDLGLGPAVPSLEEIGGQRTLVFWLKDAKIVRIESFATREEALVLTS
jgi:hypothetical protein